MVNLKCMDDKKIYLEFERKHSPKSCKDDSFQNKNCKVIYISFEQISEKFDFNEDDCEHIFWQDYPCGCANYICIKHDQQIKELREKHLNNLKSKT